MAFGSMCILVGETYRLAFAHKATVGIPKIVHYQSVEAVSSRVSLPLPDFRDGSSHGQGQTTFEKQRFRTYFLYSLFVCFRNFAK